MELLPMKKLMSAWFTGGICSTLIPLAIFLIARIVAHNRDNQEQQQNEDNNNNNMNNNNYNNCAWYQWSCYYSNNNNNNENQQNFYIPWWWFGSNEERRRRRDEAGKASPALILTYGWVVVLFGAILYYGWYAMRNNRENSLVAALLVFANLCFLLMVLLHGMEGAINVDGPELEQDSFYGQLGVLLYLTLLLYLVFALLMALWVHRRASHRNVHKLVYEPNDYETRSHHSASDYIYHPDDDNYEKDVTGRSPSLYKQATI